MSGEIGGSGPQPGKPWFVLSWRRIGDFFFTIAQLERSYQALKSDNDRLKEELRSLQREVDKHNGQLAVLTGFVQKALDRYGDGGPGSTRTLPPN